MQRPFEEAFQGELEQLKDIFKNSDLDVNQTDNNKRTVLHWACSGKHSEVVSYLLEELGADPTLNDDVGWTPLTIAASCGSDDICEMLLKHEVDIDAQNDNGCTPLHYSSSRNRLMVTKCLLKHGADPNIKESRINETPLHRATATQHHHVMQLLLSHNAYVDPLNKMNETPLILAIKNEDLPAIHLLLSYGASTTTVNETTKKTPLDYANPRFLTKIKEVAEQPLDE